ncbi:origin recognition complex subunit 4 [Colossoma macropomum]|uniref:origin recognition complex subunit 4 n=1 Tax=Colossoma macropomum TaxID=42526 RepID=UPI001864BB40|nr:origin recognition complex subunit 4 [Colossoma macropomum]
MMEVEQKDGSDNSLVYGNNPAKRGRGRPKGSVKKKIISVTEVTHNVRTSKRVDYFSPETVFRPKVKKRGRPKKIRMPGRPRKIPLTPEEEAERMLRLSKQRKRRLSKPLGRPRIHPLINIPKEKRGRGRPRKYEPIARASSQNGTVNGNLKKSIKRMSELSEAIPRKRGRPQGSFKKKRGLAAGSPAKRAIQGTPRKRGRPPGSGTKISVRQESNGAPRKRGRPPGSGTKQKVITQEADGAPRKRGRPSGSGLKIKFAARETDGIPRKRGRPPGSGAKIKLPSQEANGAPRKRGRPPGSGKANTHAKETENSDLSSSSAVSASSHPRKRGRPSKASLAEASAGSKGEEQSEVNDASAPKRPRNSFASSEYSGVEAETVADAADQKASGNDAAEVAPEGVVGGKKHKKK